MTESKKASAKQVSIAAFFSPQASKPAGGTRMLTPDKVSASPAKSQETAVVDLSAELSAEEAKTEVVSTPSKRKRSASASAERKQPPAKKKTTKKESVVVEITSTADGEEEEDESPDNDGPVISSRSPHELTPQKEVTPKGKKKAAAKSPKEAASADKKPKKAPARAKKEKEVPVAAPASLEEPKESDEATSATKKPKKAPARAKKEKAEPVAATPETTATTEEVSYGANKPKKTPARAKKEKAEQAVVPPATTETTEDVSSGAKKPKKVPARAKKEKAEPVAATTTPAETPSEAPAPAPAPALNLDALEPAVRARVVSYKQKIKDLTRQCEQYMTTKTNNVIDVMWQEIYGVGLDVDLDPTASETEDSQLKEGWLALSQSEAHTANDEATLVLKRYIARLVQGRNASLTNLKERITTQLSNGSATSSPSLPLEMEIKMLAQRTSYGARPAKANLYEDTTADALWCWEVSNIELYFTDDAQKTIKRMRKQRKRAGQQLKSLSRVVQLLLQTPVDEAKVSTEEAKIGKFVAQVESEVLKAKERERKEHEKASVAEEKKRAEQEKHHAKEEEKRKREQELEAEREQSAKRRKSLVSYFRSIDTKKEDEATEEVQVTRASGGSSNQSTDQEATMARMDAAISFIGEPNAEKITDSADSATLFQRRRALVTAENGAWSHRRHRDAKLGLMKLLQFHENYRPAYYGTFSKRSRIFRRGRRPFAQFRQFDYSVDTDEEWEEEEPGESLSGAESEDGEDEDDQLDYGDDWLAYEDEIEYVDGEGGDKEGESGLFDDDDDADEDEDVPMADDDGSDKKKRRRLVRHDQKGKGRRVVAEHKKQKLTKLEPLVVGPFVCFTAACGDHLTSYRGELLSSPDFESSLMKLARARAEKEEQELIAKEKAAAAAATASPAKSAAKAPSSTPKPAEPKKKKSVKRKIAPQLMTPPASEGKKQASSASKAAPSSSTESPHVPAARPSPAKASPAKAGLDQWLKASPSLQPAPSADSSSSPSETTTTPAPSDPIEI
ncbi:hypothetical protein Poli38472_010651 [Pythium oligandrum]|uniref:Chromatin assembly factor 1 subunit A dimerization domain-containing protein n=1 Tax=Pythium oligandrum TaxID=41045 RepID=A0A8K1FCF3_PYTOL|nr:hypothetical protein Poli38472_010651 [Pythium oligandrum]|eukprot:TMW55769.1 hypothetical protein Poli38472_010651 [Pythium oligandrum]